MEKKDWREILAGFGLWNLVEDISDDGDGKGDELQLTKDGKLLVSEIEQEIEKAREEGREEGINAVLFPKFKRDKNGTLKREGWVNTSKLKDNK